MGQKRGWIVRDGNASTPLGATDVGFTTELTEPRHSDIRMPIDKQQESTTLGAA